MYNSQGLENYFVRIMYPIKMQLYKNNVLFLHYRNCEF